eukprot:TCALIF_08340-PA protein Name:"Similar to RNF14 E3 ubiquitin-protein ligase RNF14 (Homo sapiens)" AED:0.05 eAED:0.05 QI:59/0.85/1/1/1/1/8/113/640
MMMMMMMMMMAANDLDEQHDEIQVLESILNLDDEHPLVLDPPTKPGSAGSGHTRATDEPIDKAVTRAGQARPKGRSGCLKIPVDLPDTSPNGLNVKAKKITVNTEFEYEVSDQEWNVDFQVDYLPPLELKFRLPPTYPSQASPEFDLVAPWLSTSQINALRERLNEIWTENEHCVILYIWYSTLKLETFNILKIHNNILDITTKLAEDCENQRRDMIIAQSLAQIHVGNAQPNHLAGPSGTNLSADATPFVTGLSLSIGDDFEFRVRVTAHKGLKSKPEATDIRILVPHNPPITITRDPVINPSTKDVTSQPEDASKPPVVIGCNTVHKPNIMLTFDSSIVSLLKSFNEAEKDRQFSKTTFECLVCFSEKFGTQCLQFVQCKHVYCKACMAQHFTVRIQEGCYSSISCPTEGCESTALPNQIKELLPEDVFERYESKLLETTLETMSDILPCPLLHCQCPTLIDRENNMGRCPRCSHTFCIYCKAAFHGVEPCKMKSQENMKIIKMYREANPAGKVILEKRYGKRQLTVMVDEFQSLTYLEDNTKRCPKCGTPIQKSEGCNKMTCNKCNTHFCYICGDKISHINPYTHFNVAGSDCAGRLFEGITEEEMVRFEDLQFDDDIEEDEGDSEDEFNDYILFAL